MEANTGTNQGGSNPSGSSNTSGSSQSQGSSQRSGSQSQGSSNQSGSSMRSPTGAVHAAASAAHGMVDQAVAASTPAARWLEEREHYMNEQLKGTCEYVTAHPLKSLGAAFLAGYLLGKIM
jgi:hypothetical protein